MLSCTACLRRAHSEPQTHACTGPVLLLHLCAPRCAPPAPASRPSRATRQRLLHASHAPCTGAANAAPTHARVHALATPESSCASLLLRSAWSTRSGLKLSLHRASNCRPPAHACSPPAHHLPRARLQSACTSATHASRAAQRVSRAPPELPPAHLRWRPPLAHLGRARLRSSRLPSVPPVGPLPSACLGPLARAPSRRLPACCPSAGRCSGRCCLCRSGPLLPGSARALCCAARLT
ncbi:hypothetical protein PAHAL_J015200 [Panicum hallii]|uniref:Uncharacterized protein n=1 Tax=Panicum hallii TaxID=206008 RepID=A0A2T7A9Y6_9POAL|nr:hypothetical protein PAHAL_J015200 [Panicum hallii]